MSRILDNYLKKFGDFLARKHGRKPYSTLANMFKYLWWRYENFNYDFETNGERWIMQTIDRWLPEDAVVFDVGANIGQWSSTFRKINSSAVLYVFEISPINFEVLKANKILKQDSQTMLNAVGLSDVSGYVTFYHNHSNPSNSTFREKLNVNPDHKIEEMQLEVSTIDAFCEANSIECINFLKIDTEGMDYRVLKGAIGLLTSGKIDIIQFEYGRASVETGFLLKDHFEILHDAGYEVGKIYPNYVDFKDFNYDMEDFIGPNYLAIRTELTDLIRLFNK